MSLPDSIRDEVASLAEALYEGDATAEQAARLGRLAGGSEEARRYLLHYFQLCGELHWQNAASATHEILAGMDDLVGRCAPAPVAPSVALPEFRAWLPRFWVWAGAACAMVMVGLVGWALVRHGQGPSELPSATIVARLGGTVDAEWARGRVDILEGSDLAAGDQLEIERGLAEIVFNSGAAVLLEAPAALQLRFANEAFLQSGSLTAKVPQGAAGFTIRTPSAQIVDLGTEFGVSLGAAGASEIQVFAGSVEVRAKASSGAVSRRVNSGQAVLASLAGGAAQIRDLPAARHAFVRQMPAPKRPAGSVAALRALVASHPNLIHHYPFEGTTRLEKCGDARGGLPLVEVVMVGGRGSGNVDYTAQGFDATTEAIRPFRAPGSNTIGAALQSETVFHAPQDMTVELLVRFDEFLVTEQPPVSAAVATRADERNCGFFIVAGDDGRLAHLMDADTPWVRASLRLFPREWYYVAATFQIESQKTVIHTYAANVSRGQGMLRHVVNGHPAPGIPAASRLGIGKAFDWATAHAYPWSGALDEVAIYDAVLDQRTLDQHLEAILGK